MTSKSQVEAEYAELLIKSMECDGEDMFNWIEWVLYIFACVCVCVYIWMERMLSKMSI